MAPAYQGYGGYWDPANSQAHNQQGCSQAGRYNTASQDPETSTTNSQTPSYATATYTVNNTYGRSWYSTGNTQTPETHDNNRAAEALSNLSAQSHDQYATSNRNSTQTYEPSSWTSPQYNPPIGNATSSTRIHDRRLSDTSSGAQSQSSYRPIDPPNIQPSAQTYQSTETMPQYSYNSYGTATHQQQPQYPQGQSQTATASTYQPAQTQYSTAPSHTASTTQAQRRLSSPYQQANTKRPLANAHQTIAKERKSGTTPSQTSTQTAAEPYSRANTLTPSAIQQQARNSQRGNTSVDSSRPVTIDPTQVYDPWPEQQRKVQEQRQKMEAERARKEAEERENKRKRKEEEDEIAAAEAAKAQEEQDRSRMEAAKGLAMAAVGAQPGETTMEAEMRAMFQKMREFNSRDPSMLARLWEEERQAHVSKGQGSPVPQPAAQSANTTTSKSKPPPSTELPTAASQIAQAVAATSSSPSIPSDFTGSQLSQATTPSLTQSRSAQISGTTPATAASIWPAGKKAQIARAASAWLMDRPGNLGKKIEVEKIINLLDSNPSYINLCEIFESMGISVHRSEFARALLKAVPSISKQAPSVATASRDVSAQTPSAAADPQRLPVTAPVVDSLKGKKTATNTKSQKRKTTSAVADTPQFEAAPVSLLDDDDMGSTNPTGHSPAVGYPHAVQQPPPEHMPRQDLHPTHASQSPAPGIKFVQHRPTKSSTQTPSSAQSPQLPQQLRVPQSKEEAARKRNFSELVDLTATNDSDDDEAPTMKVPNTSQFSQFGLGATLSPPAKSTTFSDTTPQQPQAPSGYAAPHVDKLKGMILVQPIMREKVARKSKYNARTIARDILLATGRHPEMRALNQHLMGLQGFLASHCQSIEGHKYDLATIRWDIIDPGKPYIEEEEDRSEGEASADADDEGDTMPAVRNLQQIEHGDGTVSMLDIRTPTTGLKGMGKIKKRRGRPPRHSFPGAIQSFAAPGPGPTSNQFSAPSSNNRPTQGARTQAAGRTDTTGGYMPSASAPASGTGSPAVTGYAAFKAATVQYDANGNPIKKRGRPVGWRKNVHGKAAQGLAPEGAQSSSSQFNVRRTEQNSDQIVHRRKRGPNKPKQAVALVEPEASFSVYECKWKDCHAQLHNLVTLRKHVLKVHGTPDGNNKYRCLWGGCAYGTCEITGKGKGPADAQGPPEFNNIHSWISHIENVHLLPVARALGDGPRGGLSDHYDSELSEAYMSDANGRIITPRATPMESLDEDEALQSEVLAPVLRRGLPRVRGRLSEEQREDEQKLQQLEARKLRLGPGLDRGGVRFATPERRRGLYDDEEFEGDFSPEDGP